MPEQCQNNAKFPCFLTPTPLPSHYKISCFYYLLTTILYFKIYWFPHYFPGLTTPKAFVKTFKEAARCKAAPCTIEGFAIMVGLGEDMAKLFRQSSAYETLHGSDRTRTGRIREKHSYAYSNIDCHEYAYSLQIVVWNLDLNHSTPPTGPSIPLPSHRSVNQSRAPPPPSP